MQNVSDRGEGVLPSHVMGWFQGKQQLWDDFLKPKNREKLSQVLPSPVKG